MKRGTPWMRHLLARRLSLGPTRRASRVPGARVWIGPVAGAGGAGSKTRHGRAGAPGAVSALIALEGQWSARTGTGMNSIRPVTLCKAIAISFSLTCSSGPRPTLRPAPTLVQGSFVWLPRGGLHFEHHLHSTHPGSVQKGCERDPADTRRARHGPSAAQPGSRRLLLKPRVGVSSTARARK